MMIMNPLHNLKLENLDRNRNIHKILTNFYAKKPERHILKLKEQCLTNVLLYVFQVNAATTVTLLMRYVATLTL